MVRVLGNIKSIFASHNYRSSQIAGFSPGFSSEWGDRINRKLSAS